MREEKVKKGVKVEIGRKEKERTEQVMTEED